MFSQTMLDLDVICGLSTLLTYVLSFIQYILYNHLHFVFVFSNNLINYLLKWDHNTEFLSDAVAFEGLIIGLSIPISLQVVSWIADKYEDPEISKVFIKETLYKLQFFLILPNIAIAILLRFLGTGNFLFLTSIYVWLLFNLLFFYMYIKKVEQYATNTDKVMINKLKEYVDEILEE